MRYVPTSLGEQFVKSHPALVDAVRDFEAWSRKSGLPEPTLTEVWRTPREQGDIYFGLWTALLARFRAGDGEFSSDDLELIKELSGLNEDRIREKAEQKFSWHMCRCAVDIRVKEYRLEQIAKGVRWFKSRCAGSTWELITAAHGTGVHWHVGFRSFEWRRKFHQPEVA
ncbi:MAG: hypothetical protein ACREXY_13860 [Gammaproteobacteria bacterium]